MIPFQLTIPSKTFVLGEYLALTGGPTLVLCTAPYFTLHVSASSHTKKINLPDLHPESPAAKLMASSPEFYQNYTLTFSDPHQGRGGLGASSAQFAALFALRQQVPLQTDETILQALATYQALTAEKEGMPPSGADLVAQMKGGFCFFDKVQKKIVSIAWPFPDISFCLIHTGQKIATHTHLQTLKDLNCADLVEIVMAGYTSLNQQNSAGFSAAINAYASRLQSKNLVAPHTQALLNKVQQHPSVLAAKGCGALGADIIFVLLSKKSSDEFRRWVTAQQLTIIQLDNKAAHGIQKEECPP